MKFAIISAGEGSRLSQEGVALPKPLVELNGTAMIDRLIRIFVQNGADGVVVIINNESPLTKKHLKELQQKLEVPLELVIQTTPSSMHSFHALSPYLKDDKFCLTTVDTIFREEEFARFIEYFKQSDADGCMAVTDYIDDEKPLYISTDEELDITGFHDERVEGCQYISGGIYCLTPPALRTLQGCMDKGMARMRNFQRQLVADGLKLKAYPFKKIVDVDHAEDIVKAEAFLNGED
ncbi:MAG: NDP-sugar synthase [Bacteroides sp.]|nr:NDP-sugar synthase [Bacteroides sp.]